MSRVKRRQLAAVTIAIATTACLPLPATVGAPTEIWAVFAPRAAAEDSTQVSTPIARGSRSSNGFCSEIIDTWIALDSVSLRPTLLRPGDLPRSHIPASQCSNDGANTGNTDDTPAGVMAVVTSFQGGRYHPEVVRALAESPEGLRIAAGSIAQTVRTVGARGLLLDFQDMTADDLETLLDVSRMIADSSRGQAANTAKGPARSQIGLIIPATDSAGYPARLLARIADVLVVRLFPEHGVGNPPGPVASPSWFARRLGMRAGEAGVNRLVAGISADGVLWDRRKGATRVSYVEAMRLAEAASTAVVRDPASRTLHASSARDGWELWVADHELIEELIAEGRRIGVTRFALFGLEGADPALWTLLPRLVKR